MTRQPRQERLRQRLQEIASDLSGYPLEELKPEVSFLELGFDSLFLTQLSTAYKKAFGVKITFRQLFDLYPSMTALSAHIDSVLPSDQLAEPPAVETSESILKATVEHVKSPEQPIRKPEGIYHAARTAIPRPETPAALQPRTASKPPLHGLEAVLLQQLDLMAEQLRVLEAGGYSGFDQAAASVSGAEAIQDLQEADGSLASQSESSVSTERLAVITSPESAKTVPLTGFGPRSTSADDASHPLSPRQERHLKSLIERYTKKTRGSKDRTQRYRRALADPRTAAGFNRRWKEMVYPIWVERSLGSKLWDVDGNEYIDLLNGFGPNFFGHSPRFVTEAIERQLRQGFEVGPQTPLVGEAAEMICQLTGMDRVSFTCSGSEAVQAAIRLSRTVTGRDKVVLFTKDYHGNFDQVLVREANRGGRLRTVPSAPGIPFQSVDDTYVLEYGADESLEVIKEHSEDIAAVLVEPIQSRRPEFQPREFLHRLREITCDRGIVLVFDEVVTGFRVAPGGAQAYYGIEADLATYGKVAAGGMPIGIVAGREAVMSTFDGGYWQYGDDSFPGAGVTFFAGTFVRHPLAIAAVHASLKHMISEGPALQERVTRKASTFATELNRLFEGYSVDLELSQFSSIMYLRNHEHAELAGLLHYHLRYNGVHILEGFPCYMTDAHSEADIGETLAAFRKSIEPMIEAGIIGGSKSVTHLSRPEPNACLENQPAGAGEAATHQPVPQTLTMTYPSTALQREMWLAAQMNPDASAANNGCNVIELTGPLDTSVLREAISELVSRHEALRCKFSGDGTEVIISAASIPEVKFHDLSGIDPAAHAASRDRILDEDGRRVFDLVSGPHFSFRILKLAAESHLLVFTAQMIICDGWGFKVVIEELGRIYSALIEKGSPALEPAQQMREYVNWLSCEEGKQLERQSEQYWISQLVPLPRAFDFKTCRVRPPNRTLGARRESLRVSSEIYQQIKRASREHRNTPFAALLTGFAVWLHRLSGSTDLVISVPFAGQGPLELTSLVGQGVHALPIRFKFDHSETFRDLLAKTRGLVLDAQEHWNTNLGGIVQELDLPSDSSRLPLTSVMFNMDPAMSNVNFSGCHSRVISGPRLFFTYDFGLNVVDEGESLLVECDYNTALYDSECVSLWLRGFGTLLEAILSDTDTKLCDLPSFESADQTALLARIECTPEISQSGISINAILSTHSVTRADAVALECGSVQVTYHELEQRAALLADRIVSRGLQAGWAVAISLEQEVDFFVAALGVLRAGCAFVAVEASWSADCLRGVLLDSGAVLIVTETIRPRRQLACADLPLLDFHAAADGLENRTPGDKASRQSVGGEACFVYSAGSDAPAKGDAISHKMLADRVHHIATIGSVSAEDVFVSANARSSMLGLLEVFAALSTGARIVFAESSLTDREMSLKSLVEEYSATVVLTPFSRWRQLLSVEKLKAEQLKVICVGEAPPQCLPWKLRNRFKQVQYCYGKGEAAAVSLTTSIDTAACDNALSPVAGSLVRVLDDRGQVVPPGVIGELVIGDEGVGDSPSESGRKVNRTGDLARYRADGRLELLGSADRQLTLNQYVINPVEVEAVLLQHPMVEEAVLIAPDSSVSGARLVAYVAHEEADPDGLRRLRHELHDAIDRSLPGYMRPSALVLLDQIPRNAAGSIDYAQLPAPTVDDEASGMAASNAPRNATEAKIARLWAEALSIDSPSVTANFFEIGGQSLQAVALFAKLEKEFGLKLPLALLLKHPTIEELAQVVAGGNTQSMWSTLVPIQPAGSRPPLFLVHGAGGNVLLFRALGNRLSPDYPVYGLQSKGLDGNSQPLQTIEEMAREYLREVRSIQPRGPYHLAGYCLGGTIAYEMAQILVKEGESVGLLAMLDTYNYSRALHVSFHSFLLQKFRFHLANLSELGPGDMLRYFKEKARIALGGELRNLKTSPPRGVAEESAGRATSGVEFSIQAINDRAAEDYFPKPYSGDVTMIKPRLNYKFYPDPKMGYGDLILGRLELVEVGTNPHAMLLEPHVQQLATELVGRIDRSAGQYARVAARGRGMLSKSSQDGSQSASIPARQELAQPPHSDPVNGAAVTQLPTTQVK